MTNSLMVGAWTEYKSSIPAEAKKVFDDAFEGFVGVQYTPIAYATQVVSGENYSFFCNAIGVYPGAISFPALIDIYKHPNEKPHLTQIRRLDQ